ncbi:MAG: DUF3078 domain-containing protein [Sphingobacteriales bacterium]|nr:MAG: DUF3078 domain-containing protein [Sphingobacteriales bacterium]
MQTTQSIFMKKHICIFLLLSFLGFSEAFSQADTTGPWAKEAVFQLNFSQVALSNWQGGGQSTVAGAGYAHFLVSHFNEKHIWENRLDLGYGLFRQGKSGLLQKSDDMIKFMSKYSQKLSGDWNYVGLVDFNTTIMPGYKYREDSLTKELYEAELLSRFMAPGYVVTSLGFEYRPDEKLTLIMAPVSGKMTFVLQDSLSKAGAYGVEPGQMFRAELGATVKNILKYKLMKNILFESDLNLFANYKTFDQIDVNWIAGMIFTVNNYFNAKISTNLIYDQDIDVKRSDNTVGPAVQFKEALSIGIQYKLK